MIGGKNMLRDTEALERIQQQLGVKLKIAYKVYDETERQRDYARYDGIKETLDLLRSENYDIPYSIDEIERKIVEQKKNSSLNSKRRENDDTL
jgi:hypothetical protein